MSDDYVKRIAELEAENARLRAGLRGPLAVGVRVLAGMCSPINPGLVGTVAQVGAAGVTIVWEGGGSTTLTIKMAEALARA